MRELTELQKKVVAEARNRLFSYDDYVGVDLDSVPSHKEIESKGFVWAVAKVVQSTTSKSAPYREE